MNVNILDTSRHFVVNRNLKKKQTNKQNKNKTEGTIGLYFNVNIHNFKHLVYLECIFFTNVQSKGVLITESR